MINIYATCALCGIQVCKGTVSGTESKHECLAVEALKKEAREKKLLSPPVTPILNDSTKEMELGSNYIKAYFT